MKNRDARRAPIPCASGTAIVAPRMAIITPDQSRDELAGFPDGYEPMARDDLGDILAVDGKGKVWQFPHGAGAWNQKSPAFSSVDQLREYVGFQREFDIPHGEDLD